MKIMSSNRTYYFDHHKSSRRSIDRGDYGYRDRHEHRNSKSPDSRYSKNYASKNRGRSRDKRSQSRDHKITRHVASNFGKTDLEKQSINGIQNDQIDANQIQSEEPDEFNLEDFIVLDEANESAENCMDEISDQEDFVVLDEINEDIEESSPDPISEEPIESTDPDPISKRMVVKLTKLTPLEIELCQDERYFKILCNPPQLRLVKLSEEYIRMMENGGKSDPDTSLPLKPAPKCVKDRIRAMYALNGTTKSPKDPMPKSGLLRKKTRAKKQSADAQPFLGIPGMPPEKALWNFKIKKKPAAPEESEQSIGAKEGDHSKSAPILPFPNMYASPLMRVDAEMAKQREQTKPAQRLFKKFMGQRPIGALTATASCQQRKPLLDRPSGIPAADRKGQMTPTVRVNDSFDDYSSDVDKYFRQRSMYRSKRRYGRSQSRTRRRRSYSRSRDRRRKRSRRRSSSSSRSRSRDKKRKRSQKKSPDTISASDSSISEDVVHNDPNGQQLRELLRDILGNAADQHASTSDMAAIWQTQPNLVDQPGPSDIAQLMLLQNEQLLAMDSGNQHPNLDAYYLAHQSVMGNQALIHVNQDPSMPTLWQRNPSDMQAAPQADQPSQLLEMLQNCAHPQSTQPTSMISHGLVHPVAMNDQIGLQNEQLLAMLHHVGHQQLNDSVSSIATIAYGIPNRLFMDHDDPGIGHGNQPPQQPPDQPGYGSADDTTQIQEVSAKQVTDLRFCLTMIKASNQAANLKLTNDQRQFLVSFLPRMSEMEFLMLSNPNAVKASALEPVKNFIQEVIAMNAINGSPGSSAKKLLNLL